MKLNKYFETGKHAIIFGLGNLVNNLLSFFLLPLYTSYMTPAEFGVSALLSTSLSFLRLIALMGFSTSIYKHFFATEDMTQRKKIISTATIFILVEGIVLLIFGLYCAPILSSFLFESDKYANLVQLMFVNLVSMNLQIIPLALYRATKRSSQYIIFSISQFGFGLLSNILFIAVLKLGLWGLIFSQALTCFIFMIVGLVISRDYFVFNLDSEILKKLLSYGYLLIFSGFFSFILVQSDRLIIQRYLDSSSVGFYSLAYKIGMIINSLFVQPFQLIWLPSAFEKYGKEGAESFYEKMLTYYLLVAGWFTFGLSIFSREVLLVMSTTEYHWVYKIVPFITYAYLLYGMYMVVNIGFYLKNKVSKIVGNIGSAALLCVGLNLYLIPRYGLFGASFATLISYFVLFVITCYRNNRLMRLQYEWGRILKIAIVNIVLLLVSQAEINNFYLRIGYKAILAILYWIILYVIKLISNYEIKILSDQLRGIISFIRSKFGAKKQRNVDQ